MFKRETGGGNCRLPAAGSPGVKVDLSGEALQQYATKKRDLNTGDYLASTACAAFLSDAKRIVQFGPVSQAVAKLKAAVDRQTPFDGPATTISQFAAGLYTSAQLLQPTPTLKGRTIETILRGTPVCAAFVPYNGTAAYAQAYTADGSQAKDVYLHSKPDIFRRRITQGMILHEALHNLTGLTDDELVDLLDVDKVKRERNGTIEITIKLVQVGCAGQ